MNDTKYVDNIYNEVLVQSVLKYRTIWINEVVDEISMTKVMYYLNKLEREDIELGKKEKITIINNSLGGLCYQGLMVISKILSMIDNGYEIETITGGMSASMSFMIGLCGSNRKAYRYSTFLCHQPSGGMIGTSLKIKRESEELERLWVIFKEIIKNRTKMNDELLDEIYNTDKDLIIDSKKALELGIIHEII